MNTSPERLAAASGLAGIALNLVAVGALGAQPHCYKPGNVGLWLDEALAAPTATTLAAVSFTVGLALFVPFMAGLARRDPGTAIGASLIGAGALLDAAGTMTPVAALHTSRPVGEGLLWLTLLPDAAFNGLLGLGLLAVSATMDASWPKPLRGLLAVAGLASLPVMGQFASDDFAKLLMVSGPLWAVGLSWTAVRLARR